MQNMVMHIINGLAYSFLYNLCFIINPEVIIKPNIFEIPVNLKKFESKEVAILFATSPTKKSTKLPMKSNISAL